MKKIFLSLLLIPMSFFSVHSQNSPDLDKEFLDELCSENWDCLQKLEELLKKGANANALVYWDFKEHSERYGDCYASLLQNSAIVGDIEVGKLLLKYGANCYIGDDCGPCCDPLYEIPFTPLQLAVEQNDIPFVRLMLNHKKHSITCNDGPDLTCSGKPSKDTILEAFSAAESPEMISLFLNLKNVKIPEEELVHKFSYYCYNFDPKTIELILKYDTSYSLDIEWTLIHACSSQPNASLVKTILKYRKIPKDTLTEALIHTTIDGNKAVAELLLKNGADPQEELGWSKSALQHAQELRNWEVVDLFYKYINKK